MAYNINVINRHKKFKCRPDQSLLTGMQHQQKQAINIGCRGGGCGICKIRILSGNYMAKKMSSNHVTPEQRTYGIALSCRVFPRSDMTIESDHFKAAD